MNNDIKLRELEVNKYTLVGNTDFHKAISHQTSLESLKLKADPEDSFRDDIDALVTSISALTKLKYLNLVSTSEFFRTAEVLQLATSLTNLEELWFGRLSLLSLVISFCLKNKTNLPPGGEVSDAIWPSLSTLANLKSLNIHALSTFTASGILNYISTLRDTNQGFLLSVMNQIPDHNLSDDEQTLVRQSITAQVDGQFDYVLFRDVESEDESLSD